MYYDDEIKVTIYLDGLSKTIYGNEKQIRINNMIRNQLEDMDIDVVSIAASNLNDPEAHNRVLIKIAKRIGRKDLQKKYK